LQREHAPLGALAPVGFGTNRHIADVFALRLEFSIFGFDYCTFVCTPPGDGGVDPCGSNAVCACGSQGGNSGCACYPTNTCK
jgi:hypothetical protein